MRAQLAEARGEARTSSRHEARLEGEQAAAREARAVARPRAAARASRGSRRSARSRRAAPARARGRARAARADPATRSCSSVCREAARSQLGADAELEVDPPGRRRRHRRAAATRRSTTRCRRLSTGRSTSWTARWSGCGRDRRPRPPRQRAGARGRGAHDRRCSTSSRSGEARLPGEVIALERRGRDGAGVRVHGRRPPRRSGCHDRPSTARRARPGPARGRLRRHAAASLRGASTLLADGARPGTLDREPSLAVQPPSAPCGDEVAAGAVLGEVPETEAITFRALVPPGLGGTLEWIAPAGEYTVADPIARVSGEDGHLAHAVAGPAAAAGRASACAPTSRCCTGQRALDLFFPIARGGSAAVPGGFGTGQDRPAPADREVVRRRRDRLRRLRRARQRDGRRPRGDGRARGPAHRPLRCSTARC